MTTTTPLEPRSKALHRLEPGTIFAEDFVIERLLAQGGMGAVYVVEQRSTGHKRALKVMHPDIVSNQRSRERFAQEAKVGAQIKSPYVVEVTAAGVDEATGTPWLVMELLEGESLGQQIERGASIDHATLREVFEQLGDALGSAHAAGVVHRDLKPENIFISVSRIRGVPFLVKVLDFGIAALISESKNSATVTTVIGSPLWMAPEQADVGARVGAQTDVWALGLIAYNALTGRLFWPSADGPPERFNLSALLCDIVVHPIPPASARAAASSNEARLPPGFDAWFAQCVVRDVALRFPDARAAVSALLPLLSGVPIGLSDTLLSRPAPSPTTARPTLEVSAAETPQPPSVEPRIATRPKSILIGAAALTVTLIGGVAAFKIGASSAPPVAVAARPPALGLRGPAPARVDSAASGRTEAAPRSVPSPDAATAPPPDAVVAPPPDAIAAASAVDVALIADAASVALAGRDVAGSEGRLEVVCRRRCRILVDGTEQHIARRGLSLAAGPHTVVAERDGDTITRAVTVVAGQTARLALDFEAVEAPDQSAPTAAPSGLVVPPTASAVVVVAPPLSPPLVDAPIQPVLPTRPDRAEIERAFAPVVSAARACGASGRVFVLATVAGDGHVVSASVEGEHAHTPLGECIANAVRQVRLPPFRQASILISQPLNL